MYLSLKTYLYVFFAAAILYSCNSSSPGTNNVIKISPEEQKKTFEQFSAKFTKVSLPAAFPLSETITSQALDKNEISTFFNNSVFQPAFSEKDVPDLAENAQTATYFPVGILQTDAFTALLIMKKDENNYYYLSTFNADGDFIDGVCIAFTEGTDTDKTERVAALNDDLSIQIRQTDIVGGKPHPSALSAFFEISADGSIKPLKEGAKPQPA